jgi:hypothetical protein
MDFVRLCFEGAAGVGAGSMQPRKMKLLSFIQ